MLRKALALFVAFAALSLVATAADKGEKKTLEGTLVCGKCSLKEDPACSNVLLVKENGKEVKYYLKDKGKKEKYHKCSGEKDVTVTGTVTEKGGKKYITMAKVVDKK